MAKKEKKEQVQILPNECSTKRWIVMLIVAVVVGLLLMSPLSLLQKVTGSFMGVSYESIANMLVFVPTFVVFVVALKGISKTSLKDFVLGAGESIDKKECLLVLGLYAGGFAFDILLTALAGNIRWRGVDAGEFAFLFGFMLLFTWMQTTWEELLFRGVALRWACKNKVNFNKKALIAAVVTSLLFALSHCINPEVTSQSGIGIALAILTYSIPGFVCFIADLHFGSLLPGIIIHFVNNFLLFTVVSEEVSAVPVPTLLSNTAPHTAAGTLLSTVICYLPVTAYIIFDILRKKKAAAKLADTACEPSCEN